MSTAHPSAAPAPTSSGRRRGRVPLSAAACLLGGLWGTGAAAAPVPLLNASFESPALADGVATLTVPSWTQGGTGSNQSGVYNPTTAAFAGASSGAGNLPAPAAGPQAAFMNTGGIGSATLTSATPLGAILASTKYTLTVALGVRSDFPAAGVRLDNVYVEMTAGASGASLTGAYLAFDANTLPAGSFKDYAVTFSTGASGNVIGQALSVDMGYQSTTNSGVMADNVRLDASPVPEPATPALLLVAGTALLRRRAR
ncbi:MAG: hypothetical protein JWO31_1817 [Phycisphaerales bacterium]|nr:hypothetical protein [Phycisphaerales bacterium]